MYKRQVFRLQGVFSPHVSAKKRKCGVNAAKIKLGVYRQTDRSLLKAPVFFYSMLISPSSEAIVYFEGYFALRPSGLYQQVSIPAFIPPKISEL